MMKMRQDVFTGNPGSFSLVMSRLERFVKELNKNIMSILIECYQSRPNDLCSINMEHYFSKEYASMSRFQIAWPHRHQHFMVLFNAVSREQYYDDDAKVNHKIISGEWCLC
jgi:hypothetical protein